MSNVDRYILDAYVLGDLTAAKVAEVDARVASDPAWAEALAELEMTYGFIGLALPPVEPSPDVLDRLMRSIATTSRFESVVDSVAKLVKVAAEKARDLLNAIDDATRWEPGPAPFISLFHLEGLIGLASADVIAGFIKLPAGSTFPTHTHLGPELVMPVQGSYVDEDGTVVGVGQVDERAPGTSHYFTVPADGPDLVYLALVWAPGVQIGDLILGPGTPDL